MNDLIENKLYSIAELTTLLGHSHEYIRALLLSTATSKGSAR